MAYERNGEWGGYKITEAKTGWVVEFWSREQGAPDGLKVLVPYGAYGYQKGQDLNAMHNDYTQAGEVIAEYAKNAKDNDAKVLNHGQKVL